MGTRIQNRTKMKQLIDFSGCSVGNGMYPTDIDGIIEYKNSKYILFEVKYRNAAVPIGQKLALKRMVDDFSKSGKQAIVIICSHNVKDASKPVVMAQCKVREIYDGNKKRWEIPEKEISVREVMDRFQETSSVQCVN